MIKHAFEKQYVIPNYLPIVNTIYLTSTYRRLRGTIKKNSLFP